MCIKRFMRFMRFMSYKSMGYVGLKRFMKRFNSVSFAESLA